MDPQAPLTDWRGTPIEVGCSVIWRSSGTEGSWAIGVVKEIKPIGLVVEWGEHSFYRNNSGRVARWVRPGNVTVWFTAREMEDEAEGS